MHFPPFILSLILICGLSGCAQLPSNYQDEKMTALTNTSQTLLGEKSRHLRDQVNQQKNSDKLTNQESVTLLLSHGVDAFHARLSLIAMAEKSIDLQYFIWHADTIGRSLLNEVIKAADRGVRVRILLDDINLDKTMQDLVYAIDQHPNIHVKLFNPFANRSLRVGDYLTDTSRVNRRMHNKSFSVDNQVAIVGGRNIADQYFSADKAAIFVDLDVLTAGPIVNEIEKQFDDYWNSEVVYPVSAFDEGQVSGSDLASVKKELADYVASLSASPYAQDLHYSTLSEKFTKNYLDQNTTLKSPFFYGNVHLFYDDPRKGMGKNASEVTYLKSQLLPYLSNTTQSFEIISPYFVPGASGVQYLENMVKNGIKVRVLTNSLSSTDGVMAQSGYARHRYDLLKAGVTLYELRADITSKMSYKLRQSAKASSALHAKTYIFDREEVFIGSFNFDPRSANINSEIGLLYDIPNMAKHIATNVFDDAIKSYTFQVKLKPDPDNPNHEKIIWIDDSESHYIEYDSDPNTSFWRRLVEDFYSILPIESQL